MAADQHVVLCGGPRCSALGLAFIESVPCLERIKIQMTFKMVKGRMSESKECRNQGRIESGAPEGRECAARPPGGGVEGAAAAQRSTARAAFEGASPPHYRPAATQEASFSRLSGQHHGSRRGGAGPAGVEQGLRSVPGTPVQVSTLGAIAVGDPSILRSLFGGVHSHPSLGCSPPCISWRSHLCSGGSEAGLCGKSAPGHQVETLSGRAPAWSLETRRRWGLAVGRDAWPRAPLPKAYADQPGDPAAGAARATPRLRVPALRPGSASTGQLVEE